MDAPNAPLAESQTRVQSLYVILGIDPVDGQVIDPVDGQAKVQLRWDRVRIGAPKTTQTRHMLPVELWALLLTEVDPPEGAKPLRWVLLTTVPIESRKQALRCLRWYTWRWRIQE